MRAIALALLAVTVTLSAGCSTKGMPLEAEGLAHLPVAPIGVGVSWDQGKRHQKYTVPAQKSPG